MSEIQKTVKIGLVTIGDEILIGQITDTNSAWIGNQLTEAGLSVSQIMSIGDDEQQIVQTLTYLSSQVDLVIMTGGLGPTKDDITVKSIASFLKVPLEFHEEVFEKITGIFEKMQRPMSDSHRQQCYLPTGVTLLNNSMGTAPGMCFYKDGLTLISLPGVPYEMKAIFSEEVLPKILVPKTNTQIFLETFLVAGMGETEIEDRLTPVIADMPKNFSVAYLPALGQVRVRLSATYPKGLQNAENEFHSYKSRFRTILGQYCFATGDTNLETYVGVLCREKNLKIGTVESCTGGRVSARLAAIPGASQYFMGGIVCYDNEVKENLVNVPPQLLKTYGAVSEECVTSMVHGGLKALHVDVVVSISGIAGPTGGTEEKPAGTVWMAVGNASTIKTKLLTLGKKREQNLTFSTQAAINFLRLFIEEHY